MTGPHLNGHYILDYRVHFDHPPVCAVKYNFLEKNAYFFIYIYVYFLIGTYTLLRRTILSRLPMPYSSEKIANFFLGLAQKEQVELTPLKLQKLLYFAHGWHLVLDSDGDPLLDEDIEAWKYGPVVPSIYHKFKEFRNNPETIPLISYPVPRSPIPKKSI